MPTLAKRAVGALLALLGVVLTVIGLWYAIHLGGGGTATFSTTASGANPVLVPQTVLNRIDGVVKVTATPRSGGTVWLAAAAPSDAKAVLGRTAHTTVTGVSTRPWQLQSTTSGSGAAPALSTTDVWRNTETGDGAVSMTIEQANAPESVIAQATRGQLERVELTWERKSWFVQSVIAALVGLFLLLSGLSLLWSTRPRRAVKATATATTLGTATTTGTPTTPGTPTTTTLPATREEENA
ncbi:hypothetical protein LL946_13555 [Knoellia locipacati]|uniref:hypothetical protein n=1 Tax=Knoellia locipacati TaxID=882824 RepID=UPI00384BA505